MLAIQNPINHLANMSSYHRRNFHVRQASAPVVVRPTHTPGLLSLSRPAANPQLPRPQQQQVQPRAPRSSPRAGRTQRNHPRPVQVTDENKQFVPQPEADKVPTPPATPATQERSTRGRQPPPPATHDQSNGRRSMSLSIRPQPRRPAHQPSPPPPARIPQQTDTTASSPVPVNPLRAQPALDRPSDSNLFDPFVVHPSQDNESPEPSIALNGSTTPSTFRAPPELATRPTGRLARRRQNADDTPSTPTPTRPVPVPRTSGRSAAGTQPLSRSVPVPANVPHRNHRPNNRRARTGPAVAAVAWDFPICDDSDDVTPPSTPIRESASVPSKQASEVTWQQQALRIDEPPRTAPLSATFKFPATQAASPTPAQRRRTNPRNHQRVPSEGMFAMSADEDSSSSDAAEELKALVGLFPKRREVPSRRTPSPVGDARVLPAGFYAGSVYQNSPSPDELPVPAFKA